ncbi:MAG: hypothetical protein M1400_00860 [Patescibacteria group bacterium]|nr:hypothetical protein [Patescibacteria group bacterium]
MFRTKKIFVVFALSALLAAGCNKTVSNSQNNAAPQSPGGSQKLADQPYYKYAYLISGGTLSPEAKKALAGFSLDKKTLTDGNLQITLTAQKAEYHNQQYVLHSGEQLYFIEKFLADDKSETNEEKNMKDDSAVVVDSQGNIVGQPTAWTPTATSSQPSNP